jgi:hypothetical protein
LACFANEKLRSDLCLEEAMQTGGGSQPKHPTVATERDPRCDHLAPLSVPCTRPDTRVPLERRELEIRWGSTPRRRRRHGDVPEPDLNRTTRAPLHFYMGGERPSQHGESSYSLESSYSIGGGEYRTSLFFCIHQCPQSTVCASDVRVAFRAQDRNRAGAILRPAFQVYTRRRHRRGWKHHQSASYQLQLLLGARRP